MEKWDLYNAKREKSGITVCRGEIIPKGLYHLSVSVWIVNQQGQYLLSQRHPKKQYPLYWECTGGSVLSGESSLQGAIREVKEELGISLNDIVSVDLFVKANASIKRFSLSNKKPRDYLLRGKVFCGCCDHAMSLRNGAWFYCRHSEVAETLPCHGVRIKMADLEQVVFETIRAQMCPALGIDSNKDKLDLQTVQQAEHEEKLRSIQDSKRHLYEQYALGEIDLETYRTRKAVYDTELVQAKNVHAVITAQTKQIKSDYEIKLKQQEIVQEVGNANMLTKALIDRLINKVYVFPGDRIEIEYATQDFLETKQSEKEV